jgi:hypothetical protein
MEIEIGSTWHYAAPPAGWSRQAIDFICMKHAIWQAVFSYGAVSRRAIRTRTDGVDQTITDWPAATRQKLGSEVDQS